MSNTELLVRRDAFDPPLPPKNQRRVDEFGPWEVGKEARTRWLLASEASLLAWFGTPDAIYTDGGEERWVYERVGSSGHRERVSIYLHRGRVIRVLQ